MLAADGRGLSARVETVWRPRPVGLYRLRLVLVFGLLMGLGGVPLWQMVSSYPMGMVLGPGNGLGSFLGELALLGSLLRLGASASLQQEWFLLQRGHFLGHSVVVLYLRSLIPHLCVLTAAACHSLRPGQGDSWQIEGPRSLCRGPKSYDREPRHSAAGVDQGYFQRHPAGADPAARGTLRRHGSTGTA